MYSPQMMAPGWDTGEKRTQLSLGGHWELDHGLVSIRTTQPELFLSSFFGREEIRSLEGRTEKGLESECD